jgi:hypothetical protein
MPIDVLYSTDSMPDADLVGILVAETKWVGRVNNLPLRRRAVPYEALDIYKSSDRTIRMYVRDGDLNVINLTGATCVLTVKLLKSDSVATIQKSTANASEGLIGAADNGECFFYLVPADTSSLDIAQYVFDVRITLSSGKTYTVLEGVMNLLENVG